MRPDPSGNEPSDEVLADRFELRRRIGAGSFGVVYEAFDRVRRAEIALKWLSRVDGETVFRFKNEFRSLADISHPNVAQLFDLASDDGRWFFTMELVPGVTLPEHLRPTLTLPEALSTANVSRVRTSFATIDGAGSPADLDGGRDARPPTGSLDLDPMEIRHVFAQLAAGVQALHEHGKLHRDLKCQNVLVTPSGRVVLLDFGLVQELHPQVFARGEREIAGTPLYMAPEQCSGDATGPASDWYAFGVMLFRALTRELPFSGSMFEVMAKKQRRAAPRPSELTGSLPEDLEGLCVALLARDPNERPRFPAILEALGAKSNERSVSASHRSEHFVGRRRELRLLDAARRRVAAGSPVAVHVHGQSGLGKTALVRHFLERLHAREPETWILEGRCYERETLPYKALDGVVDSLSSYLRDSPDGGAAFSPEGVEDLVRIFPQLSRVDAFAEAATPDHDVPDPQERRRRAVRALFELLARIADRHPVVVFIDDVQWGDRDSATVFAPLLEARDAPPVLWVTTHRSDEAAASPFLRALRVPEAPGEKHALIEVTELDDHEARELFGHRLETMSADGDDIGGLLREAGGSPLFIELLARHAEVTTGRVDLGAILKAQLEPLSAEARALVELLAVRGQPLATSIAAEALGVEAFDLMGLTHLRNARLVRTHEGETGRRSDAEVELALYHDRIRETVVQQLDAARERDWHARLAETFERVGGADPETLAYHLLGAGDQIRAFGYQVEAAERAERALAFERAVELWRAARELLDRLPRDERPRARSRQDLLVAEADALRFAGRGAEAAAAYLIAADSAPRLEALELRRLAAEQFLFSGHLDEGRATLSEVLEAVGLSMPRHPVAALGQFALRRAQVQFRGTRFEPRASTTVPPELALRIDVCRTVSVGLAMIDPVRAGTFQALHLLMALEAGDPIRVARAVAVEVPFSATGGPKNRARTAKLTARGQELAAGADDDYVHGLLASSSGGAAWLEGRWGDAFALEVEALSILRRRCTGVAWELASSTIVLLDVLWRMGRWKEMRARAERVLGDAVARGDRFLEVYLRVKFGALGHLLEGDAASALRESREALSLWSQESFQLLHFWELYVACEAHLYAGQPELAEARLRQGDKSVRRSLLLSLEMYAASYRDIEGRVAVSVARGARGRARRAALRRARRSVTALSSMQTPWARAAAAGIEAGLNQVEGDLARARRALAEADAAFTASEMRLHAVAMRARRFDDDLDLLDGFGLREPSRWLDVLAPGSSPALR